MPLILKEPRIDSIQANTAENGPPPLLFSPLRSTHFQHHTPENKRPSTYRSITKPKKKGETSPSCFPFSSSSYLHLNPPRTHLQQSRIPPPTAFRSTRHSAHSFRNNRNRPCRAGPPLLHCTTPSRDHQLFTALPEQNHACRPSSQPLLVPLTT